ncbi:MAG TPA: DNA gyrase subunit A [Candidatus Nanoarchaeia archaeon]|nr:DNA gyrase subunit A [Candidatus Nanoarchaeia archaeon]
MVKEIQQRLIEDEMKKSYVDYAMSVITHRALPNAKDGLKPVHRRILYAMSTMGIFHNKSTVKSARITGECMGKYHPHGNAPIYESLVRMAQDFSLRYPLVKGQGNFGSIDGDSPAAERYTEAKLSKIADEMLHDLDKETVDFIPNYDNTLEEPTVLPAKIPNLLINGSTGIAVGMATNIPPHNISEILSAVIASIDNPEISITDLMSYVKGPDFPTGGIISGTSGIKSAYLTGRGKVIVKARTNFEDDKIIITEIPYMVNKSTLIEEIADLVKDKRVESISDIRDESDREGMRIVIKLKRDADPNVVLNQLFTHSQLKTSFGVIMLALLDGEPRVLNLKDLITAFISHRKEVVIRRTKFDLRKAEERAHILLGLKTALENIDAVVQLIKKSQGVEEARNGLMGTFKLTDVQSNAILDMKLQRLTSLETEKLNKEYDETLKLIFTLQDLLSADSKIFHVIKNELLEIKEKYGDNRKTEIAESEEGEIITEDLIEQDDVVITVSTSGYIKQLPLSTYKTQGRGGKGVIGAKSDDEDIIQDIFVTSNKNYLLFFSSEGKVYWLKAYQIPEGSRYARGKAIVNLFEMDQKEKVNAVLPIPSFDPDKFILFATKKGLVKKTSLQDYSNPRKGGIIAISLREGDEVVDVALTDGKKEIIIASKQGLAVKFDENDARDMGRTATGVRGINLSDDDEVIGMQIAQSNAQLLTVTENGFGKRTPLEEYRLINRGGKGVINIQTTQRNGHVASIKSVFDDDELILISKKGIVIRVAAKDISSVGRNTQGVTIMRLDSDDKVIEVAKVVKDD